MPSKEQIAAVLMAIKALADVIREKGEVPSGELYANVMGHVSLETYNSMVDRLVGTGLVKRTNSHLLIWVGPKE